MRPDLAGLLQGRSVGAFFAFGGQGIDRVKLTRQISEPVRRLGRNAQFDSMMTQLGNHDRPEIAQSLATIWVQLTHSAQPNFMPTDTLLTLKLPEGYSFVDLKIRRCADDAIDLDMDLVKLICNINGLDFAKVCQNPGPVVSTILTVWYKSHLASGGEVDLLMEELKTTSPRLN